MAGLEQEKRSPSANWAAWLTDPILVLTLGLVFSLDQITKAVIRHSLVLYSSIPAEGEFRLTHTTNTGSAFGLFPDQTFFLILASFVGIAVLILVYRNHIFPNPWLRLSLGLQLGGALGNLVDRLRMGEVTDFIDVGAWPIFNLADAAIVSGIAILVGIFSFSRREDKRAAEAVGTDYTGGWSGSSSPVTGLGAQHGSAPFSPWTKSVLDGAHHPTAYCPICGYDMEVVPTGWHCSYCGANERVESNP